MAKIAIFSEILLESLKISPISLDYKRRLNIISTLRRRVLTRGLEYWSIRKGGVINETTERSNNEHSSPA